MSEGDDIQLNLVSTSHTSKRRRENPEPKVSEFSEDELQSSEFQFKRHKKSNTDTIKKKSDTSGKSYKRKKVDGDVISSLFKKNPSIPDIKPTKKLDNCSEELFADESFDKLDIHPYIISNLKTTLNINQMTYVQKLAIPPILSGKDVLVKSQTGSGKTLAYAIPILQSLQSIEPKIQRTDGTFALIVVPTRELAIQSYECCQKLATCFKRIVVGCLMGGEKKKSEKARLRKGINILVSTPGRLIDHLEHTSNLSLSKIKWLILDEADRLLDLGYEKDISNIITKLNEENLKRQTVMLSATLSSGLERLAGLALSNPQIIDTAVNDERQESLSRMVIPANLKQYFIVVPMKLRLVTLAAFVLLKSKFSDERKILVFLSTQDMVDFHARLLHELFNKSKINYDSEDELEKEPSAENNNVDVFKLHGNMTQQDRTQVFLHFKEATFGILLCTDVGARGLDLPDVDWIIQYSAPGRVEEYVHRVGRTCRIGRKGRAVIFLLPSEVGYVELLKDNEISMEQLQMEEILRTLVGPRTKSTMEDSTTNLQLGLENAILADDQLKAIARQAFLSHVRAYATYPVDIRHIFNFKNVHLGHLAKSLALRDTPTAMGARNRRDTKHKSTTKTLQGKFKRVDELSEFASGF